MADFCTCGTELVPDSLFCHKCGKPQRDIVVPETQAPPPQVTTAQPEPTRHAEAQRPSVSFHNPVVMRIALIVAMAATVLSLTLLPLLSWPLAGFFAVLFYRRRTGFLLDVGSGARLGMITGVLMAAMSTVIASLLWLPAAFSGQLSTAMQEQAKYFTRDPAAMQQMFRSLSGTDMAFVLLFGLGGMFVLITGLSMAGGALGAKFVRRH